jgi:hypothetical protein
MNRRMRQGAWAGAEAETIRQPRDRLKGQPQEGSLIAGARSGLFGGYASSAIGARPAFLRGPRVSRNDPKLQPCDICIAAAFEANPTCARGTTIDVVDPLQTSLRVRLYLPKNC